MVACLRVVATLKFLCEGMALKVKSVKEIEEFLRPYADSIGAEIVEVEMKVSKNPSLTIYIETEDGVDLNTLEKFHNLIDAPLDEFDPTFGAAYTLNVSSPGVDRPFKTERDFERNLGNDVEIKLYAPLKGEKFIEGEMIDFDKNTVTILVHGKEQKIERTQIAKINQAIKFD